VITDTDAAKTGRRQRRFRLLLGAGLAVGLAVAGRADPAGAGNTGGPGLRSLCAQIADRPPGGAELTTDPAPGAPLRAGQTVAVRLRWDEAAFGGADLHRVAHCVVTIDGRLRLDLSAAEAPSPNDGQYRGSFAVPADLVPGDCLCVLGVASGPGFDGRPTRLGGSSCVTVTEPAPPAPPAPPTTTAPPPPGPPPPPATSPPRPPAVVLPATPAPPVDPVVLPATESRPLPLTELPRTGPSDVRLLLALAGTALAFGGGAITTRR
jgi:hypothetical protein